MDKAVLIFHQSKIPVHFCVFFLFASYAKNAQDRDLVGSSTFIGDDK